VQHHRVAHARVVRRICAASALVQVRQRLRHICSHREALRGAEGGGSRRVADERREAPPGHVLVDKAWRGPDAHPFQANDALVLPQPEQERFVLKLVAPLPHACLPCNACLGNARAHFDCQIAPGAPVLRQVHGPETALAQQTRRRHAFGALQQFLV
jgi:hypothetical protein